MNYKGYIIQAVRDFKFMDETRLVVINSPWYGKVTKRVKTGNYITKETNIIAYEILDPMEDMDRMDIIDMIANDSDRTILACKARIDQSLAFCVMKDNTKKSWDEIGGYPSKERMDELVQQIKITLV